jgi:hypothetical protein
MSMDRIIREDARLIILKALAEQPDETLNSGMLETALQVYGGISRPRAWVHGELDYLAEMGAVTLVPAGTVKIATLTDLGKRHVDRQIAIEGVKRPSRREG